ncbi:prokineticin receptor 2-like [Antedon mediterranea]|uniref:prokineticin receptor 2-like n=1 Tax=Antedon mediterranea TaxID=105859 RepID=UPI003AF4401D
MLSSASDYSSAEANHSGTFQHTFEVHTLAPFVRSTNTPSNMAIFNSSSFPDVPNYNSYDYYSDYNTISSPDCYTIFVQPHVFVRMMLSVTYLLLILVCGFGNSLLIFIILSQRRLRSITNLLIANLAFSDMMVAIWTAPFAGYYYMIDDWVFGDVLCPVVNTVKSVSMYVSVTTLLVIAIDRYQGIFHPLEPRMTKPTLVGIILGIWVFAILICLPTPLFTRTVSASDCERNDKVITYCAEFWENGKASLIYIACITVLEFILPMIILSFVYVRIGIQLWFHRAPPGHVTTERQQEITNVRKQKTIPMLITVVVAFGICWAPYYCFNLLQHIRYNYGTKNAYTSGDLVMYYVAETVAMINGVISTIIFFILSPVFRKELQAIFRRNRGRCCSTRFPRVLRIGTRRLSFRTPKTNSTNITTNNRNGYMPIKKMVAESTESKV